jgi:3-oxoacyl-[acyl-carrier protein] reductase
VDGLKENPVAMPASQVERWHLVTTAEDKPLFDAVRPVALVTGVGRSIGIGAGIARRLAQAGWNVGFTYWTPYDARMAWGIEADAADTIAKALAERGADTMAVEADLADPGAPERVFDQVERHLGDITALVMCHCESVDSGLLDTTLESFDRHFGDRHISWEAGSDWRLRCSTGRVRSPVMITRQPAPPTKCVGLRRSGWRY